MNENELIVENLNRYFALIDTKKFDDDFQNLFCKDGVNQRPNGNKTVGPAENAKSSRESFSRFKSTQHLTSGFLVDTNEDKITFRVNVVAMHLWGEGFGDSSVDPQDNYFLAGGVVSGEMKKEDDTWRIAKIKNDVVWRKGVGFQEMLRTK